MNDKQKSIENMLQSHKPQADSKFQHNLEQRLMARLHEQSGTQEEADTVMMMKRKRNARSRLPLTLAAAVLAIFLVGGLVLFLRMPTTSDAMPAAEINPFEINATHLIEQATEIAACSYASDDSYGVYTVREGDTIFSISLEVNVPVPLLREANCITDNNTLTVGQALRIPNNLTTSDSFELTATQLIVIATQDAAIELVTPTPAPDSFETTASEDESGIPIIIAAQDIALGEVIDETMVYRVFYPRPVGGDALQRNHHFGGFFGNLEDVTGKVAIAPIRAFNPIDDNAIAAPRTNSPRVLPDGQVAVAIPFNESMARFYIQNGQSVRIISSLNNTDLQGYYPDALREYADTNQDDGQITISLDATVIVVDETGEFTPQIGESVITLAMTPNEAQLLLWLVNEGIPITFAVTGEGDTNIVPYYLPPEGFIGDYARVTNGSHVQVLVFIPASAEADSQLVDDGNSTLIFESFVNIGTYTKHDEEGNIIETGTSARLLVDVIYAEMLETLRLHNIPYTYTLLPMASIESQVQTSDDDYIVVEPPFEKSLLGIYAPPTPGGQGQVIIFLPDYDGSLPINGITTQSGTGILILDGIAQQVQRSANVENPSTMMGFLRLLLAPEDAGIFDILEASGVEYHYTVIPQ